MPDSTHVELRSSSDLKRFAREVRRADKDIGRALSRGLRSLGRPVQADVKAAARALPSKNTQRRRPASTSARAQIARGVSLKTSQGLLRVWVDPSKIREDKRALPSLFEGPQPWRHRVFGHDERWVTQDAHPWFEQTARRHQRQVLRGIGDVISSVLRALQRKAT